MAYKPQVGAQMAAPNVIPMADIMLVLLIIFMVVTPMLQDKDDAVVVAITSDGNIYLGNTRIQKEDISGLVKDHLASRLDKIVYVKSDARAKYGRVVEVVDEIRSAGVDQLGLLTQKNQNAKFPLRPPSAD